MSYLQQLQSTRIEIASCLENGDENGLKIAVIKYAKILRTVSVKVKTYKDRALLNVTASNYELIAAYIVKEGISKRVADAIKNNGAGIWQIANSDMSSKKSNKSVSDGSTVSDSPMDYLDIPVEQPMPVDIAVASDTVAPPPANIDDNVAPPPADIDDNVVPSPVKADVTFGSDPTSDDTDTCDNMPSAHHNADGEDGNSVHDVSVDWSADIFEKFSPATVTVATEKGHGTGFFISNNGYFLTNHHVAFDNNKLCNEIFVVNGNKTISVGATLIDADKKYDVALLRIDDSDIETPYIPMVDDFDEVRAGSNIVLIGNALSLGLAPVTGAIRFPHFNDDDKTLAYTAMTNRGDSGSPLINMQYKCVGIHKARESEEGEHSTRGIAYATPADRIRILVGEWIEKHKLNLMI